MEVAMFSTFGQGMIYVLISAFSFGTLGLFTRIAYQSEMSVLSALTWRFLVAGFLLWLWDMKKRNPISPTHFRASLLMGAIGYTGQAGLFFLAIYRLNSGLANVLLFTYPVMVTLQDAILKRKLPRASFLVVLAITAIGCLLTLQPETGSIDKLGILAGLGAAIWYSVYLNIGARLVKGCPPLKVTTYVCIGAAAALIFYQLFILNTFYIPSELKAWIAVFGMSILGTIIPVITLFEGMALIGAAEASIISTIEPVITVLLGYYFLNETLALWQGIGISMIVGSILWLQWHQKGART